MALHEVISNLRSKFDGFNSPAKEQDLAKLRKICPSVPEDVITLYQDHDGSLRMPQRGDLRLVGRLMPIEEVIDTDRGLRPYSHAWADVGEVLWLWTDDNSNYCGIFTDGPVSGYLCVLDHNGGETTPAFRSIESFLSQLISEAENSDEEGQDRPACDVPTILKEIPQLAVDPVHLQNDRKLSSLFYHLYLEEPDEDIRRLYASCSICLTPFEDTESVVRFFDDPDMWTPQTAVRLLEIRRWRGAIAPLEKLACEGTINGDNAAMGLLVEMQTDESRQAVTRLEQTLQDQKLKALKRHSDWLGKRHIPRW